MATNNVELHIYNRVVKDMNINPEQVYDRCKSLAGLTPAPHRMTTPKVGAKPVRGRKKNKDV